jgi:hypothetical protein
VKGEGQIGPLMLNTDLLRRPHWRGPRSSAQSHHAVSPNRRLPVPQSRHVARDASGGTAPLAPCPAWFRVGRGPVKPGRHADALHPRSPTKCPAMSQPWSYARFWCPGPPKSCSRIKTHQRLLKRDCGPKRRLGGSIGQPAALSGYCPRRGRPTLAVSPTALAICEQGLHR